MMNRNFILLLLTGFLGSCTREASFTDLGETGRVKIDESSLVITKSPAHLQVIDDTLAAAIINRRSLSVYHTGSGKNVRSFSMQSLDLDSLLQSTFGRQYSGQRVFTYDSSTAAGISDGNCQLHSYYYSGDKFYIYCNAEVQVRYVSDAEAEQQNLDNEKVQALRKKYSSAKLLFLEFVEFIVVADKSLRLEKIIPLYENKYLKQQKYTPLYQLAFAARGDEFLTFIAPGKSAYPSYHAPMYTGEGFYSVAAIDPEEPEKAKMLLHTNQADYRGFRLKDYYSASHSIREVDGEYLFLSGKQILNAENGKMVFDKKALAKDEWISNYYLHPDHIVMSTMSLTSKARPSEMDKAYAIDSLSGNRLRIFEKASSRFIFTKEFPAEKSIDFDISASKIHYIEKKDEHYYLVSIAYTND